MNRAEVEPLRHECASAREEKPAGRRVSASRREVTGGSWRGSDRQRVADLRDNSIKM
ncbi:MAG TPA: hypothetical protein VFS60_07610 [Thermoanaerobaculia bacterium]|nr:hypothetical protein [Thermoanaerobaculia bacterium]